jgi:hypothetical protein
MANFDPEQKAQFLLSLLRGRDSGIGENISSEFRALSPEQVAQTLKELKHNSEKIKVEYDIADQVVGVTLAMDDRCSIYVVSPMSLPV